MSSFGFVIADSKEHRMLIRRGFACRFHDRPGLIPQPEIDNDRFILGPFQSLQSGGNLETLFGEQRDFFIASLNFSAATGSLDTSNTFPANAGRFMSFMPDT